MGIPRMKVVPLDTNLNEHLPVYDWESCSAAVLTDNPSLLAAQARVDRARFAIQRARKEPIPNVDLMVSVRQNNLTGSDNANVQLGVPLPIFDKNQGNISSTEAEWVAACNEVKRIQLDLQDRCDRRPIRRGY